MSRAIVTTCPQHPRRPDWSHPLCLIAIGVNRQNPGWGHRTERLPGGELAEWVAYTPIMSWTGPDAFLTSLADAMPGL